MAVVTKERIKSLQRKGEGAKSEIARLQSACNHHWKIVPTNSSFSKPRSPKILFIEHEEANRWEIEHLKFQVACKHCGLTETRSAETFCPACAGVMHEMKILCIRDLATLKDSPTLISSIALALRCGLCSFTILHGRPYRPDY